MLRLEFLRYYKEYDFFAFTGWREERINRQDLQNITNDLVEKCGLILITLDHYQKATKEQLILMKLYCPVPLDIVYF